jgi:ArsR family transcriptional regulator
MTVRRLPDLTTCNYFHNIGNMKTIAMPISTLQTRDAVLALEALAQQSRLDIFRLLVEAGPVGMPAGAIAARMALPAATLSFHLAQLKHAGLLACRRDGRSLIYSAEFGVMNALVAFLTDNCCGGNTACCVPAAASQSCMPAPGPASRRSTTPAKKSVRSGKALDAKKSAPLQKTAKGKTR